MDDPMLVVLVRGWLDLLRNPDMKEKCFFCGLDFKGEGDIVLKAPFNPLTDRARV